MKLSDISELHLAAVIAGATALGGVLSSVADAVWIDAATDRQTDVQMVQLAIGILSSELPEGGIPGETPDAVLRGWAVDTLNAAAEVKLDAEARSLLVNGRIVLDPAIERVIERMGVWPFSSWSEPPSAAERSRVEQP